MRTAQPVFKAAAAHSGYRYTLQPVGKKHTCPNCQRAGKFRRYVDTLTGELLPDQFGRCDRENSCGYHLKPTDRPEWLKEHERGNAAPVIGYRPQVVAKVVPPLLVPPSIYMPTMGATDSNLFAFVANLFGAPAAAEVWSAYRMGAHNGAVVFWQFTEGDQCRGGKLMKYDPSGHRLKGYGGAITWEYAVYEWRGQFGNVGTDCRRIQCLFGQHLLKLHPQRIGVVESEKTALLAECASGDPSLVWLAAGGSEGLTADKVATLRRAAAAGARVTLYPDTDKAGEKWHDIASANHFAINTKLLELTTPSQQAQGYDLGDEIIKRVGDRVPELRPLCAQALAKFGQIWANLSDNQQHETNRLHWYDEKCPILQFGLPY